MSANGGDPVPLPDFPTGMILLDISRVQSELLLAQIPRIGAEKANAVSPTPLWVASALGGAPRRLGSLAANDAAWSPDGNQIVYVREHACTLPLQTVPTRDSLTVQGEPFDVRWSPDGRSIRFVLRGEKSMGLWEVSVDGSLLRVCCPSGTTGSRGVAPGIPNGKYFIFTGGQQLTELWAVREKARTF